MVNGDNQLREVPDSQVPAVLEVLRADGDWPFSFLMHQKIKMMQEFKKSTYNNIKQTLYSLGNTIEDGTFVVLSSFKGSSAGVTYVHVYNCADCGGLAQALQSSAIPWATDQIVFDVVYGSVRPSVLETLKAKGASYREATNSLYWVNPDEQHTVEERKPPSDVSVMFLNEGHAKEVNERWSMKFLDSENVIKDCILSSIGMGVVRKSDKKLLSYILLNHAGVIIIMHTEPEERQKGYGSLLVATVLRESAKRSRAPIALVSNGDHEAEQLLAEFHFVPFIPVKYYGVTRASP